MFKVCGIIGISKTKFFNFSSTERVKHNTNINKYIINNTNKNQNHSKPPKLVRQSLFNQFQQRLKLFLVFY